jgi:adenylate kinase
MVVNKLSNMADTPYLLDGFPRTIPQAEFIAQQGVAFDKVIYFAITLEAVLDRMSGRLTCKACGASFHAKYNAPRKDMACDLCGATLVIRDDDKPETVERRFATYLSSTQPLLDFYMRQNIVAEIDAEQPIATIQAQIKAQLE